MKQRGATPEEDRLMGWIEEGPITRLERDDHGWSITVNGWTCGLQADRTTVEPKLGDIFTTFGQIGYSFHGQALNGVLLWYSTIEEEAAQRQAEHEAYTAKLRSDFEAQREQLDRDYDGLPPLFKMRIDRFRAANPDFRWEHESYEMFVCTQAVVLGEWAMETASGDKDAAIAAIEAWDSINSKDHDPPYDYKAQLAVVPGWSDGHSGNTHGCAVMLAKEHVRGSERVPLHMGASLRSSAPPTTPNRPMPDRAEANRFCNRVVKATTTLGDTPESGAMTMEWPIEQFSGFTLERLFYNSVKVTVEKEDGTVIVYEPEWSDD